MDSDKDVLTPPEIKEAAKNVELNLLPPKSRKYYEQTYIRFMDYRKKNSIASFSENVFLVYFSELSKKIKCSTLWSTYSMLRATINVNNNVDIAKYLKLRAFLKGQSDGYRPKKSKVLEKDQILKFLLEAPDDIYLSTKVALIFGIFGACRCGELQKLNVDDIEDMNNKLLITLPDTKTKTSRSFVVSEHLHIYRKYVTYRPLDLKSQRFFFKFWNGKGSKQLIGIHKFGTMPQEIAAYLKLTNIEQYTGHCFRRTSATLLANSGADITMLKRHGGWKSSTVAEGYVDDSVAQKSVVSERILTNTTINNSSACSSVSVDVENTAITVSEKRDGDTSVNIHNCSNFTINVYKK